MAHVIEFSRKWREIRDQIGTRSFLLLAPRHYGKSVFFDSCFRSGVLGSDMLCVRVTSHVPAPDNQVDYGRLWESVKGRFRNAPKSPVADVTSFRRAFETAVVRENQRVVLLISGSVRRNEPNHYNVLATFHWMMANRPTLGGGKLTAVAADDYSLFYWNSQPFLESPLYSYRPEVHIAPLEVSEIEAHLETFVRDDPAALSATNVALLAERIHEVSGGQPGIAQELISGLPARSWAPGEAKWNAYVKAHQRSSTVLENLMQALGEDPEGYFQTALAYIKPCTAELNSSRIHVLRQLGILQRESAACLRLCPGAITTMLREFGEGPAASRHVGTVVTPSGSRYFVEDEHLTTHDDDLVILHVSDLHVGENYRHRVPKVQKNPNADTAGELLRDDLASMGLLGRIDALILSGDFVEYADPSEFNRAREVVEEILEKIGLTPDRMLLIPGNHDIKWNPGELASDPHGKKASREGYDTFFELLMKKRPNGELDVLEVSSRSGKTRLRVLGLDSNRVEGPAAAGIGFVARSALRAAQLYLDPHPSAKPDSSASRPVDGTERTLTWMAVHHHIYPASSLSLAEAETRKVSVMGNSVELLDFASRWGIEMVLHGHEHQPSVTDGGRWPVDGRDGFAPVTSVGAGSFGTARDLLGPISRNHYYVIHRRPVDIIIRSRCQGAGGIKFLSHADLHVPRPTPAPGDHPPAPALNGDAAGKEPRPTQVTKV
jgi:Calcineurin-like phosphoesterase